MGKPIVDILRGVMDDERVFTDVHTLRERRHDYWVLP